LVICARTGREACPTVFPVPPLQQLGIVLRLRSEIHGAAEYVEDAAVDVVAHFAAEVGVKGFRVPASQFRHVIDSQQAEIGCYGWPHSRDALDRPGGLSYLSDHTDSSFPLGSVK
jgi:hypothetical protein